MWRGTTVPIPGLFAGHVGPSNSLLVNTFTISNLLTRVLFRVTDPPSGGTVAVELNTQADGAGASLGVTIADGDTFAETTSAGVATGGALYQIITAESGLAMNLSGEYELNTVLGVSDYFTTLARVKIDAEISGADADRDVHLNNLIASVTQEMQSWMGRTIVQGTNVTERIDGAQTGLIYTRDFPIIALTTILEGTATLVDGTDFESVGVDLRDGRIVRIAAGNLAGWQVGRRNISVTYDHGHIAVPEDLADACLRMVVQRHNESKQGGKAWRGLDSKGVDPNAVTSYDKDIWTREVIPVMQPYRVRLA